MKRCLHVLVLEQKESACMQWVLLDPLLHLLHQIPLQLFLFFPRNNKTHELQAKWPVSHNLLQLLSLKLLRGFDMIHVLAFEVLKEELSFK